MCKIFEKIFNTILIWFLKKIGHLSKFQNGFHKKKSTINGLTHIHLEINKALQDNQSMSLISLNIKKAYDTTWKHRIITKLSSVLSW
jgi:hypothetical protein